MRRELIMLVTAGLLIAATACAGGDDEATAPAATTVATSTAPSDPAGSDGAFPAGEPVDLVYIADSSSVGEPYAELAAERLGREVRLNQEVEADPEAILGRFADRVAEAEIIVFYFNSARFEQGMPEPQFEAGCLDSVAALEEPDWDGPPWTPGTKWEPIPAVPTAEDWRPYRDWLSEVWEAIWDARDGRPLVLRGHDMFNPFIGQWVALGVEPECTAYWEGQADSAREAAEANGATFVSFYDVINGPDHDEDARLKGWVWEDGMHANDTGAMVAAEALAAVGFELNEPPPTATAFAFATDSMCDWFSGDDLDRIVAAAQQEARTAMDFGEGWSCDPQSGMWTASLSEVWLTLRDLGPDSGEPRAASNEYIGHALLDDSVGFANLTRTHVWHLQGISADLLVEGHDDELLSLLVVADSTGATRPDDAGYTALGLAVADAMLVSMNWIDA